MANAASPLRTEDRKLQRQAMYKVSMPPWKETYRKKCFERLRLSRAKLLDRFRQMKDEPEGETDVELIKDIMNKEWLSLWDDEAELEREANIPLDISFIPEDENVERILEIFEEIEAELKEEEQKLLREHDLYEESYLNEEKELCSALELLTADEVVCPICKKNPLIENKGVIFCKCGLRINTEQDGFKLADVKAQLDSGIEIHNFTCDAEPEFSMMCVLGTTNLFMTCEVSLLP
ncbi:RPA-interacting protein A isoform X2 [Octopus bimaculoides]|nr:RPA-interacting protein A isoform X2 [Octopus bimaculoides]XP_014777635.1 RPA-interacting protein A isoform X2 [Octopus bimaculoides]XP_014777636.1 RPA-interacting protein A isoform X2 [Octopus bimaculoides]|eukprot:XP_014777634.1 PREDICTED: RPA-interacting protein A-like [Octopus bimaculoides]